MDLADAADVVLWEIPAPGRDRVPLRDLDLHDGVVRERRARAVRLAAAVLLRMFCDEIRESERGVCCSVARIGGIAARCGSRHPRIPICKFTCNKAPSVSGWDAKGPA